MKFLPRRSQFAMSLIAMIALVSFVGCRSGQASNSGDTAGEDMPLSEYITAKSLRDLVTDHPVIVIGCVVERGDVVNMARNVNDISQPDPSTFILGQIYQVRVDRYLKGAGASSLQILQPEGFINQERTSVTEASIKQARKSYSSIPMATDEPYLLFLTPVLGFAENEYFTGIEHPWRFSIPMNGMAQPESPWSGASEAFPSMPSSQLIEQVEQLATPSS